MKSFGFFLNLISWYTTLKIIWVVWGFFSDKMRTKNCLCWECIGFCWFFSIFICYHNPFVIDLSTSRLSDHVKWRLIRQNLRNVRTHTVILDNQKTVCASLFMRTCNVLRNMRSRICQSTRRHFKSSVDTLIVICFFQCVMFVCLVHWINEWMNKTCLYNKTDNQLVLIRTSIMTVSRYLYEKGVNHQLQTAHM